MTRKEKPSKQQRFNDLLHNPVLSCAKHCEFILFTETCPICSPCEDFMLQLITPKLEFLFRRKRAYTIKYTSGTSRPLKLQQLSVPFPILPVVNNWREFRIDTSRDHLFSWCVWGGRNQISINRESTLSTNYNNSTLTL